MLLLSHLCISGMMLFVLQQMANQCYLKSQKPKEVSKKFALLEKKNVVLKEDKALPEQKVKMLKEVIQKNRGNFLY